MDFDSSESFLAIVSVSAFACVLLDQIIEKMSFDKTASHIVDEPQGLLPEINDDNADLVGRLTEIIKAFCSDSEAYPDQNHNEAQLIGSLHAYINSKLKGSHVQIQPQLVPNSSMRADMSVTFGDSRIILEIKRSVKYQYNVSVIYQVMRYLETSGLDNAILFLGPRRSQKMSHVVYSIQGTARKIIIVLPEDQIDLSQMFSVDSPQD